MAVLNPRIVIAEDEFLIRMAAAGALADAGFDVTEAENAEDVLAILAGQAAGFRLLFTDVQMPGAMDGLALSHHIRLTWPHIGLVIASGNARPHPAALPAGSIFLPKPYDCGLVAARMHALIGT
jgi:CheY-like chemotaxis protein